MNWNYYIEGYDYCYDKGTMRLKMNGNYLPVTDFINECVEKAENIKELKEFLKAHSTIQCGFKCVSLKAYLNKPKRLILEALDCYSDERRECDRV